MGRGPGGGGRGRGRPTVRKPPEPELRRREEIPDEVYNELPELPAGREIDALVARHIIGLRKLKVFAYFEGAQSDVYRLHSAGGKTFILPEYCREIAAAWEVVQALPECQFTIQTVAGGETAVQAALVERGRASKRLAQAGAETAPLAICRAALLAAGRLS